MNNILKKPIEKLGYDFIAAQYIPKGKDEYFLRNIQNRSGIEYKKISAPHRKTLIENGNTADDWNKVFVSEAFDPMLVRNNSFYGLVRIGKLTPYFHEFKNLRLPVGIYNSRIISCDIGDNVVIDNVNYLAHYIIGNDVMLVNINELATTDYAKFGNGVLKKDEPEAIRIWMEVCNENAGRGILPFNGMKAADAWLWSRHRDDEKLQQRFKEITDKQFDTQRGYYGKIGDRTVIKNCRIIKDVWIGSDAYIKGANKLKNLTINSNEKAKSQIGEGCELVNGIISFGCRIFYGVKAVRFFLGANSQLKYGARLINSYLAENSTISCCEVLNSLIFPAHEQHHNNSFLCAATLLGQSNMAAGATIGSNHNSRGADGEIIAGRGFWPGLCVSLKHNSKFASFTMIAKGDFPAELNIPFPFCLVSNDVSNDQLVLMPGFWFLYNMYALARNEHKYSSRDKRLDKSQSLEYNFLAPDSVNELFNAVTLLENYISVAYSKKNNSDAPAKKSNSIQQMLIHQPEELNTLEIFAEGVENSNRKVIIRKAPAAWNIFRKMILYYGIIQLIEFIERESIKTIADLNKKLPVLKERDSWVNCGGQLMPEKNLTEILRKIKNGKVKNWDDVHELYAESSERYVDQKFAHAYTSLLEICELKSGALTLIIVRQLLNQAVDIKNWITNEIITSKEKDFKNPFRQMVYDSTAEMEIVVGTLEENTFINEQKEETIAFTKKVKRILASFK